MIITTRRLIHEFTPAFAIGDFEQAPRNALDQFIHLLPLEVVGSILLKQFKKRSRNLYCPNSISKSFRFNVDTLNNGSAFAFSSSFHGNTINCGFMSYDNTIVKNVPLLSYARGQL